MPLIDYASRTVWLKLVYAGPAFAGKTTSLRSILRTLKREQTELTTLGAGFDRTLLFEFTPGRPPLREGFTTRVRLYTVPGQLRPETPRQRVLRDVDGLLFVADARWTGVAATVQSLDHLAGDLQLLDRALADVPMVVQYNQQDLPRLARPDYLEYLLNRHSSPPRPSFPTIATTGENVMASLECLLDLVAGRFRADHSAD